MSWQAIVKLNLIQHSTQMSDILYLPISNLILKIFILLPFYLFKHGHFPDSFLFIFVFSNITILYRKLLWKVTTNYPVFGFELTTVWSWVWSHHQSTRTPTFLSFFMGLARPLFRLFSSFITFQFLQKVCAKMSIQYTVFWFEQTTSRTWVSSHNHPIVSIKMLLFFSNAISSKSC